MSIENDHWDPWVSTEPAMQEVLNAARIVAAAGVTALIGGEHGTGRQWLARTIHAGSPRHAGPFVAVNCAALPAAQAEALLFDLAPDAAAVGPDGPRGYLQAAAGGTLFLDDVGELDGGLQTRLLHYLETGEVIPAGGTAPRTLDVRILAGSHRDLERAVAGGRLRADLFYRLRVVPLTLPPLRQRPRDVARLAERFFAQLAARHGTAPVRLDAAATRALTRHPWPGNVQELRNLCERLTLLLPGRTLGIENLPAEYRGGPTGEDRLFALPSTGLSLADLERDLIIQALERTGGNRSRAARLLGLTRDTLLYRLKKFALG